MLYLPSEFPLEPDLCYLNHAAVAPWPRCTAEAVQRFAFENMRRGATAYPDWMQTMVTLRARIARLIGAACDDDIALVKNTSEGLSIVASGLDWQAGDRIVGIADDFPSNRIPWESLAARDVGFDKVDVNGATDPEQALIDAIGPATRLVALSSVHYATGLRLDIGRIASACRERGVLVCLDAIQSVGAMRLDLERTPVDFVTADGHKWMLAPEGLGFFWCRPDLRERLQLHQYGWAMVEQPGDFSRDDWSPATSARRFEAGSPNMLGIYGLDASLGLLLEFGLDAVEQRVLDRVRRLAGLLEDGGRVELVTRVAQRQSAGILAFRVPGLDSDEVHRRLMQNGVICASRGGNIRFSPHFYTPDAILETAAGKLSDIIKDLK